MSIERLHSGPRMSQAVIHNGIVHLAGQVGAPGEDATAQTRSVLAQVDSLLAEAGTDKSRLLTATIWLADMAYRSEEHTSELQSLMRISYAVFCLTKKKIKHPRTPPT